MFKNWSEKCYLKLFLFVHLIVWSVLPMLRPNVPLDSLEAILWGHEWTMGFDKHPPLSGWMAEIFYWLIPSDFSMYLLSQISIIFGMIFIYKLARKFLTSQQSLLSVFLLEGCLYYTYFSPEFNVNILMLGLFPATVYYFYNAVFDDSKSGSFLFGLFAALCVLTKYFSGTLLLALLLYGLLTKRGRSYLFSSRVLYAVISFLPLVGAHLYWMYSTDWMTIEYALKRAGNSDYSIWNHLLNPLKFTLSQFVSLLGSIIALFTLRPHFKGLKWDDQKRFVFFMAVVPFFITLSVSFFTGMKLKDMWGVPLFGFTGLFVFTFFDVTLSSDRIKRFIISLFVWFLLSVIGLSAYSLFGLSQRTHFNGNELAQQAVQIWNEQTQSAPLKYVGGDMWFAGNVAHYGYGRNDRPSVVIEMTERRNSWLSDRQDDLLESGALILADRLSNIEVYQQTYPDIQFLTELTIHAKNSLNKTRPVHIYVGILMPKEKGE